MIRLNLWSTRALFVRTTAGAIGARLSLRPLTWRGAKMIRKARADRAARMPMRVFLSAFRLTWASTLFFSPPSAKRRGRDELALRGRGWGVYRRTPLLRSMRQSFRLNRRARLAASLRHHPPPRPLRASFARLDPATRKGAWREGSEGIARRCRSKDGGGKWDGVRLTMAFPEPTRPGAVITRLPLPSISLCFPSEVFTQFPHFRLK